MLARSSEPCTVQQRHPLRIFWKPRPRHALIRVCCCHRMSAEIMLDEIGRRPAAADGAGAGGGTGTSGSAGNTAKEGAPVALDWEGYSLAAGLALGLITLGAGRGAAGLADLRIEDRLRCAPDLAAAFVVSESELCVQGCLFRPQGKACFRTGAPRWLGTVYALMWPCLNTWGILLRMQHAEPLRAWS